VADLGANIKPGGLVPVGKLVELGIGCVRVVGERDVDDAAYFRDLTDRGIRVWLVLARESFKGFGPMRADGQPTPETITAAMAEYVRRYGGLLDVVEAGNEPDLNSPSSWTQSADDFERLLWRARDQFGSEQQIVTGGLASGHPEWLEEVDSLERHGLDWVNGVAIHPYGQAPDDRFPFVPEWYFGRVTDLVASYRDWLDAHGRPDKKLYISEWGAPAWDFDTTREIPEGADDVVRLLQRTRGGRTATRGFSPELLEKQGTYIRNMSATLRDMDGVVDAIHFCVTDGMVQGFGLTDAALNPLPGWLAMQPPVIA